MTGIHPHGFDSRVDAALDVGGQTVAHDHGLAPVEAGNGGKAGIKIFFLICDTEWLKPGAVDLFRAEAEMLLDAVPDAYIIPRIGLHPTNEWIKAHPEECCKYSDGTQPGTKLFTESYVTDLPMQYSMCSEKWREDAGKALSDTWDMLMSLPYADRIVGCFFAAGGTSEWYYILQMFNEKGAVLDHSESFRRNFTKYLTKKYKVDAIVNAGWLTVLSSKIITEYENRIINLHPALLPKFGGVGMWGHHVHEAVLAAKETESGCTVHFVDGGCDTGKIIVQKKVPVLEGDTPDSLYARIAPEEHKAIVEGTCILAEMLNK